VQLSAESRKTVTGATNGRQFVANVNNLITPSYSSCSCYTDCNWLCHWPNNPYHKIDYRRTRASGKDYVELTIEMTNCS